MELTRKSTMPLIYRSIRMDNNDIPLRSGQGEKYSFVNLNRFMLIGIGALR